jgi:hypothetical protein
MFIGKHLAKKYFSPNKQDEIPEELVKEENLKITEGFINALSPSPYGKNIKEYYNFFKL